MVYDPVQSKKIADSIRKGQEEVKSRKIEKKRIKDIYNKLKPGMATSTLTFTGGAWVTETISKPENRKQSGSYSKNVSSANVAVPTTLIKQTAPRQINKVTPLNIYNAAAQRNKEVQLQSLKPQKSYTDENQKKLETTRVNIVEQPTKVSKLKETYEKFNKKVSDVVKKTRIFSTDSNKESIRTDYINGKPVDVLYKEPSWLDKTRADIRLNKEIAEKKYDSYNQMDLTTNSTSFKSVLGKGLAKGSIYSANVGEFLLGAEYSTRKKIEDRPVDLALIYGAGYGVSKVITLLPNVAAIGASKIPIVGGKLTRIAGIGTATTLDVVGKGAGAIYYGTKAIEISKAPDLFSKGNVLGIAGVESLSFMAGATSGAKSAIKVRNELYGFGASAKTQIKGQTRSSGDIDVMVTNTPPIYQSALPTLKTTKIGITDSLGNEKTIYRGLAFQQQSSGKGFDIIGYTKGSGFSIGTPTRNIERALFPKLVTTTTNDKLKFTKVNSKETRIDYLPSETKLTISPKPEFTMDSLASSTLRRVALKSESWANPKNLDIASGQAGKQAFKEINNLVMNKKLYKAPSKVYNKFEKVESFATDTGFKYSVKVLGKNKYFTNPTNYATKLAQSQAKVLTTKYKDQASWSKDEPFLVSTKVGGKEHKLDLHPSDQPNYAQAAESFYGTPYDVTLKNIKTNGGLFSSSSAKAKSLSFTFLGKAASTGTLRVNDLGQFYIAPEPHRTKDIGDFVVTAKQLLSNTGQKVDTSKFESLYPKDILNPNVQEPKSLIPSPSKASKTSFMFSSSSLSLKPSSSLNSKIISYSPISLSSGVESKSMSSFISPSKSMSPSKSKSMSFSISPSRSPSPSKSLSNSISPSFSPSPSRSFSNSISPSPSKSTSFSPSPSPSKSYSFSPRPSPSRSILPSLPKFDTSSKFNIFGAFKVEAKRKGKYRTLATGLTRGEAIRFGQQYTDTTTSRSFKLTPFGTTKRKKNGFVDLLRYRQSKKSPNVYIEKIKFAISTGGEKKELRQAKFKWF